MANTPMAVSYTHLDVYKRQVPECSVQIVLRIEELVKGNAPEPAHRRKGGALHVHRDAALRLPPGHVPAGLPVEGVGGPGPAQRKGDAQFPEDLRRPQRGGEGYICLLYTSRCV